MDNLYTAGLHAKSMSRKEKLEVLKSLTLRIWMNSLRIGRNRLILICNLYFRPLAKHGQEFQQKRPSLNLQNKE